MKPLGVGLIYWQELAPLFAAGGQAVSVLELEPQTLWEKSGASRGGLAYRVNQDLLERIAEYPQRKLVHGVGHPVGGLVDDPLDWRGPLAHCVDVLRPAWASEHLSFNRFASHGGVEETSFLLPPRQTAPGVAVAARNLVRLGQLLRLPVAFETGVNYLQPRADELSDGAYFAGVAAAAQCGILLDLHNLWVNERNGRQSVQSVLAELPLERVWELHVAGGSRLNGYWLDAHDGLVDDALLDLAAAVVPRLPNLGAIIFEILPQYVHSTGLDRIARQLEKLAALWRLRPVISVAVEPRPAQAHECLVDRDERADLERWERDLAAVALGRPTGSVDIQLARDPGGPIFEQLVREFRSGRIVRALRYSMIALLRSLGPAAVEHLVKAYCRTRPSDLFTALEADCFATFLREKISEGSIDVPLLPEVLAFEHAMIRASAWQEGARLRWSVDPTQLFEALELGQPTDRLARVQIDMEVGVAGRTLA